MQFVLQAVRYGVSGGVFPLKCDRAASVRAPSASCTQCFVSLLAGGTAWCMVQVVIGGCGGSRCPSGCSAM